jgi:Polyketide cyclase / dehydrase and lipid transport
VKRVSASVVVPGRPEEAEALWVDPTRWASWIDGFGHVITLEGDWPAVGARVLWESPPAGRGRVQERVVAYESRTGQTLEVEDNTMSGRQRVEFTPAADHVDVKLSLTYEIKDRKLITPVVDLLFVRRAMNDALRRTLTRFANERKAEIQFGSG